MRYLDEGRDGNDSFRELKMRLERMLTLKERALSVEFLRS